MANFHHILSIGMLSVLGLKRCHIIVKCKRCDFEVYVVLYMAHEV